MADDSDFEEGTKFKPFGLEELPSIAHESFHQHATHLHEVMDRHTAVLVEAGKLPETHLANIDPQRKLVWMIEELNGNVTENAITIPLRGAEADEISWHVERNTQGSRLLLEVGEIFSREFDIPASIFINVDLPEPFRPSIANDSPLSIVKLTFLKTSFEIPLLK